MARHMRYKEMPIQQDEEKILFKFYLGEMMNSPGLFPGIWVTQGQGHHWHPLDNVTTDTDFPPLVSCIL